jgi:hypothetical protein
MIIIYEGIGHVAQGLNRKLKIIKGSNPATGTWREEITKKNSRFDFFNLEFLPCRDSLTLKMAIRSSYDVLRITTHGSYKYLI